jgi:hypothetical protein
VVPLDTYLQGRGAKVDSLVVDIPFSPLDIDLGHLARGEWNALINRFWVWFLPSEEGIGGTPVCYIMVRKFDLKSGILLYGHLVVNMEGRTNTESQEGFTIGIMSNDEIRARSMLSSMLDITPSFHRRSEVRLIERKWRSDPEAVMRFAANVHSAMAQGALAGKAYTLRFEPHLDMMGELKRNLGAWW